MINRVPLLSVNLTRFLQIIEQQSFYLRLSYSEWNEEFVLEFKRKPPLGGCILIYELPVSRNES